MIRTCVVGCGGIGSYFAAHIDRLIDLEQINDMQFEFYDDDKVELKNLLYQNFESDDIDSSKVDALAMRYFNLGFNNERADDGTLKGFDLVILCADNNKIRREALRTWQNATVPFIDSRANGRAIGIFTSETEDYGKTLGKGDKSSSCQNPFQIEKKEIEFGNVVIASILAQNVLSYSRTKRLPANFMVNL